LEPRSGNFDGLALDQGKVASTFSPEALPTPQKIAALLGYRWIIFAIVASNGALLYFNYSWSATLSGYLAADWNLDAGQLGLLAALGFFPYALMQIPGGYITDLIGSRKAMSLFVLLLAIGTAIFASAPNYTIAILGRTVIGFASGVIMLPSLKVLARWFRVGEFATVQGSFILLANVGSLSGTLPLAIAAERFGWRIPMWGVAVLAAVVAVATWLFLRNDPVELGMAPLSAIDPQAAPEAVAPTTTRPSIRKSFYAWRTIPTLWSISVIFFATFGALQSFQALWAGPLLRQVRGLSTIETGTALLMFTIGTGIGPILFGIVSDRFFQARKPVVVLSAIAQLIVWGLIIYTFQWLPLELLYFLFIAISALSGGILVAQVMIKELCPPSMFGTIYGIHNGSGFYGTAFLQIVTGSILAAIGPIAVATEPVYSAQAYTIALTPVLVCILIAAVLSFKLGETLGHGRMEWSIQTS